MSGFGARRWSIVLLALLLAAPAGATPVRLMTFNTWLGASQVDDGPQKAVDAIRAAGADVVGMQETRGTLATAVAQALGWFVLQGPSSVAVVSRFPITEAFALARDASGLGVRLRIADAPAQDVVVWVVHLGYTDYGPYTACAGGSVAAMARGEKRSGRVGEIADVLKRMRPALRTASSIPVFLMGDFNAPSDLDWTPAAAALHCGATMRWPASRKVEQRGMFDVFRTVWPDPVAVPGVTWSPIVPAPEPHDRIDLIFAAGAVTAQTAAPFVVGTPAAEPNHAQNDWPSDHAAMLATVDVAPTASIAGRTPQLALDRAVYGAGDAIVASVASGPANATDWIGLFRAGDVPGEQASQDWRYLGGARTAPRRGLASATVTFPAGSLSPGDYVARFLYADGDGEIAPGVAFTVAP